MNRAQLPNARLVGETPYAVHYGPYQRTSERFDSFPAALDCFRSHVTELPERATLLGATHDYRSDGLTESEREQVELAEEQAIAGSL